MADTSVNTYEWDCRQECGADNPDVRIIVVGIDRNGGMHLLCFGCAEDMVNNPHFYEEREMSLHGTHILSGAALRAIFPDDFAD